MAVIFLLASCASTTMIQSSPSGAAVYIDGEKVGTTPYSHTDTKIVASSTHITLKKEGFQDLNVTMVRNEEVDAGAVVAGIFVWVPFLWTMKYKPVHNYELVPVGK